MFNSTGFEPATSWVQTGFPQTTGLLANIMNESLPISILGRNRPEFPPPLDALGSNVSAGIEPRVSWGDSLTVTESLIVDTEPPPDFIKYIYPVRSRVLRKKFWHGYHPHRYVTHKFMGRYRHIICTSSNSSFFSHVSLFIRPSYFLLFLLPFLFLLFVFYFFFSSFSRVFQPTTSSLERIHRNGEITDYL